LTIPDYFGTDIPALAPRVGADKRQESLVNLNHVSSSLRLSAGVLVLFFATASAPAAWSSSWIEAEPWESVLDGRTIREVDRVGTRMSDALFDVIEDIPFYKTSSELFSFNVSGQRRVFDNADILNSWTVVDKFNLAGNFPIFKDGFGDLSTGAVGFSIGGGIGLDFINIRQVTAKGYGSFPSIQKRQEEMEKEAWYEEFTKMRAESAAAAESDSAEQFEPVWVEEQQEDGKVKKILNYTLKDPEENARYSKFWNVVTFPFRLPLKATALRHLESGEIISYLGTGLVEVGANVGWNLDPTGITGLAQAGVSYRTYISGTFRISVLKENDRFVKVKLTRVGTLGHGTAIGTDYKPTVLDGVVLVKSLQSSAKLIPFKLNIDQSASKSFDVGYRYDITNLKGRRAYERAVFGLMARSEELASHEDGPAVTGVEHAFKRTMNSTLRSTSARMKLAFIFRHDASNSVVHADAHVTFPDGSHHVFTSTAANGSSWRAIWGVHESTQHNFTVSMDVDHYVKAARDDSFNLLVEGSINDSNASEGELLRYILAVEDSVGKVNIFRRPDTFPEEFRKTPGKCSFYFQLGINNSQIHRFIDTPASEMWPALEKAFDMETGAWSTKANRLRYAAKWSGITLLNGILYTAGYGLPAGSKLIAAKRIHRRWTALQKIEDPVKRAETLGKMFLEKSFGYELVRLIRAVLSGETVSYYATGNNSLFGRVVDQGGTTLDFDNIATRAQRRVEFDQEGRRIQDSDKMAVVHDLDIEVLNDNKLRLSFVLSKTPLQLFIQLRVDNWWRLFHGGEQSALLIDNKGEYKEGVNTIVLDPADTGSPWYPLARILEKDNVYVASMALTNDGSHWGAVSTKRFRFLYLPEDPDDDE